MRFYVTIVRLGGLGANGMVRITKVHTGGGDGGETSLVDGTRVGKENPRVGVYGTIDEANSAIGIVRAEISRLQNPKVADESVQRRKRTRLNSSQTCALPSLNRLV